MTRSKVHDRKENAQELIHVKDKKRGFEYPLVDAYKNLKGKEVEFTLHWEHMPVVGPILKYSTPLGKYILPDKETANPAKRIMTREIDYEEDW
jgi:hypothetical protein